jgi:hypothetical protein
VISKNDLENNITIILNKIKKSNYIMFGHSNINEKIKELIKQNGTINYDDYDYTCSYKSEVYGPCGATLEIDKIYKVAKKLNL